jgi:hypothetical protein
MKTCRRIAASDTSNIGQPNDWPHNASHLNNAHFTLPLEVYQMRLFPDAPASIILLTDYKNYR